MEIIKTYRILVAFFVFSLIWGIKATIPSEKTDKPLEHVIIGNPGNPVSMSGIAFTMAIKNNFYQEEGIDADYVSMKGALITQALVGGGVDYGTNASDTIRAAAVGLPVRTVLIISFGRPTFIIAQPEIKSFKDLKGKTIGVGSIGDSEYLASRVVASHFGLDPDKDLTILGIGSGMKLPALYAKSMDAVHVTLEDYLVSKKRGYKALVNVSDIAPIMSRSLGVNQKKIRENPRQIKGMIKATLKGMNWTKNHKKEVIDFLLQRAGGLTREDASEVYDGYVNYISNDGTAKEEIIQREIGAAKNVGMKVLKDVTPSQVLHLTILNEVQKELGLK